MKIFIVITLSIVGLVGCNSGGNNTVVIDDPVPNQLKDLSSQGANSEPKAIDDAANLRTDINALFNNAIPVEVESGDSIQDVISRAEGS